MDHTCKTYLSILFASLLTVTAYGQDTDRDSYGFSLRPALNYNTIDGIKLGIWLEGGDYLTDEEGPHRLDVGLWLATKFPQYPVSYHISLEEPVTPLTEPGGEFSVRISSTMTDGYQTHAVGAVKRWGRPFDPAHYWEAGVSYSVENRFSDDYVLYPRLWSDDWKGLIRFFGNHQHLNNAGVFRTITTLDINTFGTAYSVGTFAVIQEVGISSGFKARIRGFAGLASENSHPEYLFMRGYSPAVQTLENPLVRSRGTVPPSWIKSGYVHFAGGTNLRGYTSMDTELLNNDQGELYRSIGSINLEVDFPNPLDYYLISRSNLLSTFFAFRSYLFADTGFPVGLTASEPVHAYSDAGLGVALTLNIPDIHDKPRGFVLRYELPLWLSSPQNGNKFGFRHLLGIGAIISF